MNKVRPEAPRDTDQAGCHLWVRLRPIERILVMSGYPRINQGEAGSELVGAALDHDKCTTANTASATKATTIARGNRCRIAKAVGLRSASASSRGIGRPHHAGTDCVGAK